VAEGSDCGRVEQAVADKATGKATALEYRQGPFTLTVVGFPGTARIRDVV
jgi:hypothetical protein